MQVGEPETGVEGPLREGVPVVDSSADTRPHASRRHFERFLRHAGYSRADAKRIAAHGFDAPDDSDRRAELMALLRLNLTRMEGIGDG